MVRKCDKRSIKKYKAIIWDILDKKWKKKQKKDAFKKVVEEKEDDRRHAEL